MDDTGSPHDRFFKAVFSRPEVIADAVRRALPPAFADAIDWDRAELMPTEYIGDELVAGRSDLLIKAPLKGSTVFICVLYEHQSTIDRWMPYRVLVYVVRIWESWRREHPEARQLPAVVPVVLYHGQRAWPADRRLRRLIDLPAPLCDLVACHLPGLELLVDDLRRVDDAEIEARSRVALGALSLLLLKHGRHTAELTPHLERWAGYMAETARTPGGVEAIKQALYYLYRVSDLEPGAVEELLVPQLGPAESEEIMSTARRLEEKGREEGRAEGRAGLLLHLLQKRFGELPPDVEARLVRADAATIERWSERLFAARALDDVFIP